MHVDVFPYGAAHHAMELRSKRRESARATATNADPREARRVTEAMLTMTKLDIATLGKASVA
jgi:hypothetical protein